MPLSLKLVFRSFKTHPFYIAISIFCLALGIACSLLVIQWIDFELGYDKFHKNHNRIYRFTVEKNDPAAGYHSHFARSWYGWLNNIKNEIPGIQHHACITHWYGGIVKVNEKVFESKLFFTTPSIFNVFTLQFINGNPSTALSEPYTLVLSKSAAGKYFGNDSPIGKIMEVYCRNCQEKKLYTVTAVVEDFPTNSHFSFDILAAYENPETHSGWAYHYFLLNEETEPSQILKGFEPFALKHIEEQEAKMLTPHLQNISDIHLKSHKAREFKENSDMQHLYLFAALGLFVFGAAIFNFANLQYVRVLKKLRMILILRFNGSQKNDLVLLQLTETATLSFIAGIFGLIIAEQFTNSFSTMMGIGYIPFGSVTLYSFPVLVVLAIVAGMLPFIILVQRNHLFAGTHKKNYSNNYALKDIRLVRISKYMVSLQYAVTIILFVTVITVNRQINFFMNERLGTTRHEFINIKNLPVQVTDKYQVFKEKLKSNSTILDVTSSMEDPADESMDMMPFETTGLKENIENKMLYVYPVDDNFFDFYQLKMLAGNTFDPFDGTNQGPETYILNEKAMKMLGWTSEEAIGKPFKLSFFMNDSNFFNGGRIVGVVEDFQMASMKNEIKPFVFFQKSFWLFSAQIKINKGTSTDALTFIEKTWNEVYPDFPFEFNFVENLYESVYKNEFQVKHLALSLGTIAILLSGLGLLSITGMLFQTKTKEIGIRKVNGATTSTILQMLLKEYSRWIVAAIFLAIPLAWLLMDKWLQNYVYKVGLPFWIFVISGAAVYILAMVTVSWQSWIAAGKNPVESLKYE